MHSGKKGQYANIELWFLVAAFILASVAGIDLFRDASNALDRTLLEKNYVARDLAMAVEAVYASPGDIDYTYNLGSYRFKIDFGGGKVFVSDEKEGSAGIINEEVSYRIIGVPAKDERYESYANPDGLKVFMPDFVTAKVLSVEGDKDDDGCKKPATLVLSKRFNRDESSKLFGSSVISVAGRNAILICEKAGSEASEGCGGMVVKCE